MKVASSLMILPLALLLCSVACAQSEHRTDGQTTRSKNEESLKAQDIGVTSQPWAASRTRISPVAPAYWPLQDHRRWR